jgi:hypothetical protein
MEKTMSMSEFQKIRKATPRGQRPQQWWDLFSVIGGILFAILWSVWGTIRIGSEGFDLLSPILMIGLPIAFISYRTTLDRYLAPLQPYRRKVPKVTLIGIGLAIPFLTAFMLYNVMGISNYPLMNWNLLIGTIFSYTIIRDPAPVVEKRWIRPPGMHMILLVLLFCISCIARAFADDWLTDPLNLQDGMRTDGFAQLVAGTGGAVLGALTNAPNVAATLGGQSPSPTVAETYSGQSAIDILVQNGLVRYDPGRGGYVPTDGFTQWMNDPAAGPKPVTGSRVVGEARDARTERVTDRETVQLASIGGAGVQLAADGTIKPDGLSLLVNQTRPSGWQPVPEPATPTSSPKETKTPVAEEKADAAPKSETKKPVAPTKVKIPLPPKPVKPTAEGTNPPSEGGKTTTTGTNPPPKTPVTSKSEPVQPPVHEKPRSPLTPEERERRLNEIRQTEQTSLFYTRQSRTMGLLEGGSKFLLFLADTGVDFLGNLTGKPGRLVSYAYTAAKDIGKNTLVYGGGKGLKEGVREAIVDMGFTAAGHVIKAGGGAPGFLNNPQVPGVPAYKWGSSRMSNFSVGELREQASKNSYVKAIMQTRLEQATFQTIQSGVSKEYIRNNLIKENIGMGSK